MKVVFRTSDAPLPRLVARLVAQDALPLDLDAVVREGTSAARFGGKVGQVFEAFVAGEGGVKRLALVGAGKGDAAERSANLEKAGAALTAKYLTSGEKALAIDFSGSDLSGAEAASVLFGARLRGWRHDVYRTKLSEEQKPSLAEIVAVNAPEGTAAAWRSNWPLPRVSSSPANWSPSRPTSFTPKASSNAPRPGWKAPASRSSSLASRR